MHPPIKIIAYKCLYFIKHLICIYSNCSILVLLYTISSFRKVKLNLIQNMHGIILTHADMSSLFKKEIYIALWISMPFLQKWSQIIYKTHMITCYNYRSFRVFYCTRYSQVLFLFFSLLFVPYLSSKLNLHWKIKGQICFLHSWFCRSIHQLFF